MKIFIIFVMLNVYMINSFTNSNSPKTSVVSPNRVSIKPLVVGDNFYMKTISYLEYILDIYENGDVYRHPRTITTKTGKVYNYKGASIKGSNNGNGYFNIKLWDGKRNHHFYVHRLVAINYIPNPNNLPEVNHIDGNRSNNHVSNLEWCDRTHNVNDYVQKGRGFYANTKVCQYDLMNNFIKEYDSFYLAGEAVNCTGENISMAVRGKSKTAKGFIWKYSENQSNHKTVLKNIKLKKRI